MTPPTSPETADIETKVAILREGTTMDDVAGALDMCRAIIKFHVKPGKSCSFSSGHSPFSALDAHNAAVMALAHLRSGDPQ